MKETFISLVLQQNSAKPYKKRENHFFECCVICLKSNADLISNVNYKSIIKYFESNNISYVYLEKNKVVIHNWFLKFTSKMLVFFI